MAFKMAASGWAPGDRRRAGPGDPRADDGVEVGRRKTNTAGDGDLSSRRGMVQGMDDMPGGGKDHQGGSALSEMFGYSTTLRSKSQGRATYTMEFTTAALGSPGIAAPRDHCGKPSNNPTAGLRPVTRVTPVARRTARNLKQSLAGRFFFEIFGEKWQRQI